MTVILIRGGYNRIRDRRSCMVGGSRKSHESFLGSCRICRNSQPESGICIPCQDQIKKKDRRIKDYYTMDTAKNIIQTKARLRKTFDDYEKKD